MGARVRRALPQSRSWAWGQRQLTRIAELRSQAEVMRVRADGENQAERLANDALKHLTVAQRAIEAAGNSGRPTPGRTRSRPTPFDIPVDERGQAVLAAVGGPENPEKP